MEVGCLDRTDENPFQEEGNSKNQTKIDFARLKNCTLKSGNPGLECGGKESSNCVWMGYWCARINERNLNKEECPVLEWKTSLSTAQESAKSTNSGKTNHVGVSIGSDAKLATVGSV